MTTAPAAHTTEPRSRGALIPVVAEALRIEEHCEYSNQASSLAASWSRRLHLWFGLAAAILAGGAGALVLTGSHDRVAATAALVAAVAAALVTFLNPEEHAGQRRAQAAAYRQLGNKTRMFRSIDLANMPNGEADRRIGELVARRDELDAAHDPVSAWFCRRARRNIKRAAATQAQSPPVPRVEDTRNGAESVAAGQTPTRNGHTSKV